MDSNVLWGSQVRFYGYIWVGALKENNAHMRCLEGQTEKEPMRRETLRETELKLSAILSYHMKFSIHCIGG